MPKPKSMAKAEREADFERSLDEKGPRILLWDIESTGLNASFGVILCIGYKWLGGKPKVIMGDDHFDDKGLVEKFAAIHNQCDYSVTWYGRRFDLPMVRSKMIEHGIAPLAPKPMLDLWEPARKLFKAHNNRLASWSDILGTKSSKTALTPMLWRKAAQGHKPSLKYIRDHCEADVEVLEEVFLKLRPWLDKFPGYGMFTGDHQACPACGSHNVIRSGYRQTLTRTYARHNCKDCGHWFQNAKSLGTTTYRSIPQQ